MLSRRNVRIKVMQTLYALSRDEKMGFDGAMRHYRENVRRSFELYLFNLLQFIHVAEYAKVDAEKRHAKLLPSDEDRQFSAKLAENELIRSLTENEELKRLYRAYQFDEGSDDDRVRQIYVGFAKSDEYRDYVLGKDDDPENHQKMLLTLYKHCLGDEMFTDLMEDNFPLWVDDESLIVGAIKKTIKALPAAGAFFESYRPSAETTVEFGEKLLQAVMNEDSDLLEIIEPTLKNWDVDRVAVIDMILLKMALTELVTFPTIPTKVTLNEFVEISKLYSTEKSKDFINGILDRLMKKLHKEGRIKKEGRGLME